MPTRKHTLRTISWTAFFAGLTFVVLLLPISATAAQRDGTVLFFSLEDLTQTLSDPTLSDLFLSLLMPDLSPGLLWQNLLPQTYQESPIERSYRWGDGLGVDSFTCPGSRMPLWGY